MIFQNLNLNQPSRENSVSYESVKRQTMDIKCPFKLCGRIKHLKY
ncbi:hypothetical protein OIU84_016080 [Salix udensis]|uniref:Uncharacterized protein n=1 Tax=Salix udensis TaxID=889485 RepID=A0AAD6J9K2_9ROSI|nr:hypothetical protein OIU84_016080 [Salix udensis]